MQKERIDLNIRVEIMANILLKRLNPTTASKQYGVNVRTIYSWMKTYKNHRIPDKILHKIYLKVQAIGGNSVRKFTAEDDIKSKLMNANSAKHRIEKQINEYAQQHPINEKVMDVQEKSVIVEKDNILTTVQKLEKEITVLKNMISNMLFKAEYEKAIGVKNENS